jgi:hypothetical protein
VTPRERRFNDSPLTSQSPTTLVEVNADRCVATALSR